MWEKRIDNTTLVDYVGDVYRENVITIIVEKGRRLGRDGRRWGVGWEIVGDVGGRPHNIDWYNYCYYIDNTATTTVTVITITAAAVTAVTAAAVIIDAAVTITTTIIMFNHNHINTMMRTYMCVILFCLILYNYVVTILLPLMLTLIYYCTGILKNNLI